MQRIIAIERLISFIKNIMQEAKEQGVRDGQTYFAKPQFLSPSTLSGIKKKLQIKKVTICLTVVLWGSNDEPNVIA